MYRPVFAEGGRHTPGPFFVVEACALTPTTVMVVVTVSNGPEVEDGPAGSVKGTHSRLGVPSPKLEVVLAAASVSTIIVNSRLIRIELNLHSGGISPTSSTRSVCSSSDAVVEGFGPLLASDRVFWSALVMDGTSNWRSTVNLVIDSSNC